MTGFRDYESAEDIINDMALAEDWNDQWDPWNSIKVREAVVWLAKWVKSREDRDWEERCENE